jgi:PIN domain nuclease of toxin-antitoxin system
MSPKMAAALNDGDAEIFVSAASVWEISIKQAAGRLVFPLELLDEALADMQAFSLPITIAHATAAGQLPAHHRDPFDRVLIAQAQLERLVLMSEDAAVSSYDVQVL